MSFPGYPQQPAGPVQYPGGVPYPGGMAYPQGSLPGYPVMVPRSGAGEAAITALLVIPLLVFVFLSELLPLLAPQLDLPGASGWWYTGWAVAVGVYFVLLILVRGRGAGRRLAAGALALLAAVVYAGPGLWTQLTGDYHWQLQDGVVIARVCAVVVLAVLAWGVARRRSPLWLIGLLPTALLAGVWAWVQDDLAHSWSADQDTVILLITSYYGAIIVGALCCWAFDAMRSGRGGQHPVATVPVMPMAPGPYPQPGSGGFGYPPSVPAPGQGGGYNPMAR